MGGPSLGFGLVLWSLLPGCGSMGEDTGWRPESSWTNPEPADHTAVAEGLDDPRGLAITATGLVVAEMDAGRVVSVEGGVVEVLLEGLEDPYMVAAGDHGVVVTERGGGRVLHLAEETTVLAEGMSKPGRVIVEEDRAWWLDEDKGELWMADLGTGEAAVLAQVSDPSGLAWTEQGVLVARAGDCDCVTLIDVESGDQTDVVDVEENPVDVLATEAGVFLSAESHYWPYGGWLYSVDVEEGDAEDLANSPPGPSWLAANSTHLFWVSDENIVTVPHEGGTYQTLAILTSPGDLRGTETALYWTDRHRGAVYTVDLSGP